MAAKRNTSYEVTFDKQIIIDKQQKKAYYCRLITIIH